MKYICKAPGKKSREIIKRDHKVISQCLTREYSFVFKRSKDAYLWDVDGKKYLDFAAGVAVANIGHTNPDVMKAIREQTKLATHCGFSDFYAELPVRFAEELLTITPSNLQQVFFTNSGAETLEAAYKLARWHSKKKWCIAFNPSFHGRTMGALSLTSSKPVIKKRFDPFLPVKHTPYPYCYRCAFNCDEESCNFECLNAVERLMKKMKGDTASVFIEPIMGEGGYVVPPKEFHKGLKKLCEKNNVLLCADEVQSGNFRTGKFLAMEHFNVKADIVAISKAIGGGVPFGVMLSSKKIMNWVNGVHANTFGGNLLACAAGLATIKYMKKHNIGKNAERIGKVIMKRLNEMQEKNDIIGDVRGKGLMIGVEFVKNRRTKKPAVKERKDILCKAVDNGLVLIPAGESTIRLAPPLIITKEQADKAMDIFEEVIRR